MRKILLFVFTFFFLAYADDKDKIKSIYSKFSQTFKNTKIKSVKESPVKGIYQVLLDNGNILYTDGNYLIIGHIFTFKGKDLTEEEIERIASKNIENIDLSKALKVGSGSQKVIEISDPQCPFCRKSEEFFKGKDVSRYIFFMPLPFHKNARPLAIHILCSENPEDEYKKVMSGKLDNAKTLTYCKEGDEKLKQMEEVAKMLKVRGTPMFWIKTENGWKKVEGANPEIVKMINKNN